MTQIKSKQAKQYIAGLAPEIQGEKSIEIIIIKTAVRLAESEAQERHAKQLQELKDKAVDRANVTMSAMILDGYDPEDACVKYMQELIEELKN